MIWPLFSRFRSFSAQTVWGDGLKSRFEISFKDRCFTDEHSGQKYLPVARLISTMYELKVVDKDRWQTGRIIGEMHQRGYAANSFTKPSYGAQPPPALTIEECFKWIAHFRVLSLNS